MASLTKYEALKSAVDELRQEQESLRALTNTVKHDGRFKHLRNEARSELKEIYDLCSKEYGLPNLQIYLSPRKKISVQGMILYDQSHSPTEIRIFFIRGCRSKSYNEWEPKDLETGSQAEVFETLVHEISHALELTREGDSNHGGEFVRAYCEVEQFLKSNGFGGLFDQSLRLTGVPMSSYAAQARIRVSDPSDSQVIETNGCLTIILCALLATTTLVGMIALCV